MLGRPVPYKNMPRVKPDFEGPAGKAWHVTLKDAVPQPGLTAEAIAALKSIGLDAYLIHAPGSHPWWPWYALTGCALRTVEHVPPATLQFAAATHEIIVAALDPQTPLPDVSGGDGFRMLQPLDQVVQVALADDNQGRELQRQIVRAVVNGMLVPDQDHRATWKKVLAKTSEHLREGGHS